MKLLNATAVVFLCALFTANASPRTARAAKETEEELSHYLKDVYEKECSDVMNKQVQAEWDVATDINNLSKIEHQAEQTLKTAEYTKKVWEEHFKGVKPEDYKDPILKREVGFLRVLGNAVLNDAELSKLNDLGNNMTNIYSTAKICPFDNQNCDLTKEGLSLDPDIEGIIAKSTNWTELEYAWKSWRDASGAKMREQYKDYVALSNKVAVLNGFKDMGEMWRKDYESDTFIKDMDELWDEVKPLYEELHTYVLRKLAERYPENINTHDGYIPAHVTGNMWAQSWANIYDLVVPYPGASIVDVTKELQQQGYTAQQMFETSDEFYQSLGLPTNAICYNVSAGAMIEKPNDREVLCHASAWDFQNGQDFRIKMCTKIIMEDFITIHHEMGHIQYYIQYKDQPATLRAGANPGFHEAIGDTIALSVATPQHLEKIGLLKDYQDTEEAGINALMNMALERVAFLPFGLLIDKWRWDVFSGDVTDAEWNKRWWQYRENIQKIKSPVERTENDFDPGAKFHVPGNSQYIAYFVAHILQFQLHRSLCIAAGKYNPFDENTQPLYKCDIYQSKAAGEKLKAGLSLGSSKHWSQALKAMTGEEKLTGSAILEYFKPLYEWLKKQNAVAMDKNSAEARVDGKPDTSESGPAEDQYIPIIVGSVIGALLLVAVVAYLIVRRRRN